MEINGLFKIALKLLINDKGKFFTLIIGISFAVFLMMQMTSSFAGIIQRTASDIINVGAKMWVMDPSINSANDNIPLPYYMLDIVRSLRGVKYAVPLYRGTGLIKLSTGAYQPATIIGLDDATLIGRPQMIEGNISSIYSNDAFLVVKNADYEKLNSPKIGATFEVNDHRGVIVGLAKVPVGALFGLPVLYTTFSRAIQYLPNMRLTYSYILVEPKDETYIPEIQEQVKNLGYMAISEKNFVDKNRTYYIFRTGLGVNILIMTLISFIVGLSIAGQTFYAFVLENLDKFGALKAMGCKKYDIIYMILAQSSVVGFLGYGLGVFLSSVLIAVVKSRMPNYAPIVTLFNMTLSFFMVSIIVAFSSYVGIRKVLKIDPFVIFRG